MGHSVRVSPIALEYLAYSPQLASSLFGETRWHSRGQGGHARLEKPPERGETSDEGALSEGL